MSSHNATGFNTGDGPYGPVVNGTQIVFYEYLPNQEAGYAFMALFALATLGHIVYLAWLRAWFFIPFILGGIAELFGYFARAQAHDSPIEVGPFILQNLLILTGAPFLAATVYMSLRRIAAGLGVEHRAVLSLRWTTKIYVLVDFGCIATQLIGSVLPASGDADAIRLSRVILLAGIIAQFVALTVFAVQVGGLHGRVKKGGVGLSLMMKSGEGALLGGDGGMLGGGGGKDGIELGRWQRYFVAIEVAAVLLVLRAVIRAVEYLQGSDGYIASHEAFIYVFDAALMFLAMLVFLAMHPARLVRDARRVRNMQATLEM